MESSQPKSTTQPVTIPEVAAVGDLNADGRTDFAVVNSVSNSVSVFLGGACELSACRFPRRAHREALGELPSEE